MIGDRGSRIFELSDHGFLANPVFGEIGPKARGARCYEPGFVERSGRVLALERVCPRKPVDFTANSSNSTAAMN